jgi:hypothetical protein
VKSGKEKVEELAYPGIVAVAENSFSPKMFPVMYQLFFYIRKLSVKFIVFLPFGIVQIFIRHAFTIDAFRRKFKRVKTSPF